MILYYAAGGGWGHLSRASAIIHTSRLEQRIPQDKIILLTTSSAASIFGFLDNTEVITIPTHFQKNIPAYQQWLKDLLEKFHIHTIILDTFPSGILGEWDFLHHYTELYKIHVARILQWDNYQSCLSNSSTFNETFIIEPLPENQQIFLDTHSGLCTKMTLIYPVPLGIKTPEIVENTWLIVHSEPIDEISELIQYAQEIASMESVNPAFLVISYSDILLPEFCQKLPFYPAHLLYPQADRIFTACGFNAMYQTRPFKNKHFFIPFSRRFDNQFFRATLRKNHFDEA